MKSHFCLLCIGSNMERHVRMEVARKDLASFFPSIEFGEEMETKAIGSAFLSPFSNQVAKFHTHLSSEEVRAILKQIEYNNGRLPEDKAKGIVKLDIDLLMYDDVVLKPEDMKREFVLKSLRL